MKLSLALLMLGLTLAQASPQFGFNFFGRPSRPSSPSRPSFNFFNRPSQPQSTRGFGGGSCSGGGNKPNHKYAGKDYLVSWRLGCRSFTHSGAASFCRQNGMKAISIDSAAEEREFTDLVSRESEKYFWTGGRVSGRSITWPSGRTYNNVRWSHTGGARPPRPQPDNREGNEFCVGVLNNFYSDGVKFHDISCHHKKPIICEA